MKRTTASKKKEPRARRAQQRPAAFAPPVPVHVERAGGERLHRQVRHALLQLILGGRLRPAARLPSSRALAEELDVARNTVLLALEQLMSEGYLETRRGRGTYVAAELPERPPLPVGVPGKSRGQSPRLAPRGQALIAPANRPVTTAGLLRPGEPDCADFPFKLWGRLLWESWRQPAPALVAGKEAAGHPPLRAAIAHYLAAARGVEAAAGQVVVVSGIRQALTVAARLLLDPGDPVWLEDPGYPPLRGPLVAAGARLVPVAVDAEGLSVQAGRRAAARPRLICVAPSHQYPLGMAMSAARRLALLDHARRVDAWVFEDDYESEWSYTGRLPAPLQSLDRDGRVLYAGSFAKLLFPSLRLGYLVVPPHLVQPFVAAQQAFDEQPTMQAQPALAAFIAEGHLRAHLRRQRRRYRIKQELFVAAAQRHLGGLLQFGPDPGGMHLVGYLQDGLAARMDDREASRRAAAAGIAAPALSVHWIGPGSGRGIGQPRRQGLILGYAALPERQVDAAVRRLAKALG
ncbi:MAG: PLP-dependent aminotransferase family protein [Dongiaceae bacterium]